MIERGLGRGGSRAAAKSEPPDRSTKLSAATTRGLSRAAVAFAHDALARGLLDLPASESTRRVRSRSRDELERNLHDGAQQRLVSLALALRLARGKVADDPHGAEELLGAASSELTRALDELRELARGIHPAVLTERGLDAAVEGLARRSPVPVTLDTLGERLPAPIEAAAYYVVSEARTNVAKYAKATRVSVRIARADGRLLVDVLDDGVGGADPSRGTGLRGLVDRLEALDGTLAVESGSGAGTQIHAEIPVRPPARSE